MGDQTIQIARDNICPFCGKKEATLLCDMPSDTIVRHTRGKGFDAFTVTCDKKICTECTTRVRGFDFCPDCVKMVKMTPKGIK